MKSLVLIPARYQSTRFPGKPLSQIQGKSMISRVVENLEHLSFDVAVVTDDERIGAHLKELNKTVFRVDDEVESGTERIQLAFERFITDSYQFVVNVQGDEPLLKAAHIESLVNFHSSNDQFEISTLYTARSDEELTNPNIVKIAMEADGKCLYFSRAPIPHDRKGEDKSWRQHVGVYCYKPAALKSFSEAAPSKLELTEGLEQLRALSIGLNIGAIEIKDTLIGVDIPGDIALVEKHL